MLFSRLVSKLAARTARVSGIFQTRFRKHHPGAADECPIQPAIEDIDDEHPTDNTMMSDQHTVQSLNNRGDSDQIRSATVTDNGEYRTESVAESSDSQSQIRSTVELEVHPTIENSQHQAHNTNNAYWFENEHTLCFERVTETAPVQVLWTPSCQIGRGIPWARSYADAARREHIPGARLEVDFGLPPSISIPWAWASIAHAAQPWNDIIAHLDRHAATINHPVETLTPEDYHDYAVSTLALTVLYQIRYGLLRSPLWQRILAENTPEKLERHQNATPILKNTVLAWSEVHWRLSLAHDTLQELLAYKTSQSDMDELFRGRALSELQHLAADLKEHDLEMDRARELIL